MKELEIHSMEVFFCSYKKFMVGCSNLIKKKFPWVLGNVLILSLGALLIV